VSVVLLVILPAVHLVYLMAVWKAVALVDCLDYKLAESRG
jgi:hypothetical protein